VGVKAAKHHYRHHLGPPEDHELIISKSIQHGTTGTGGGSKSPAQRFGYLLANSLIYARFFRAKLAGGSVLFGGTYRYLA